MREIKFRAWQIQSKEMYQPFEGYIEFYKGKAEIVGFDDGDLRFKSGDIILMQYTGLKDKHGKEIYDGDRVKYDEKTYTVQWDFFGWALFWKCCNEKWLDKPEEMEVVGNVYKG